MMLTYAETNYDTLKDADVLYVQCSDVCGYVQSGVLLESLPLMA
ncbi:MAG: hypothetical protein ACOX2O_07050 [Bdellovibrionota bacterium]|jgi:hypothetical protein